MTELEAVPPSIKPAQSLTLSYLTKSDRDVVIKGTRSAGARAPRARLRAGVSRSCAGLTPHPPFSTMLNKQYYTPNQKKKPKKLFHPLTPAVQKVPNQITAHSCHIILSRLH